METSKKAYGNHGSGDEETLVHFFIRLINENKGQDWKEKNHSLGCAYKYKTSYGCNHGFL